MWLLAFAIQFFAPLPSSQISTAVLQSYNLGLMDAATTRKAFCLNLYNMMVPHGYAQLGVPRSTVQVRPALVSRRQSSLWSSSAAPLLRDHRLPCGAARFYCQRTRGLPECCVKGK